MSLDVFKMNETIVRKMLAEAMSQGGDFADIYCQSSCSNSLLMEEGILKSANTSIDKGVGVRVVKGEKTGYTYTEVMDESHFLKISKTAAAIANGRGSLEAIQLSPQQIKNRYLVEDPAANTGIEAKVTLINDAYQHALKQSSLITKVTISLSDTQDLLVMADSSGRMVTDEQPMLRFSVSIVAENEQGEKQQGRSGGGGRVGFGFLSVSRVQQWVEAAVAEALLLLKADQAPSGMMPVILAPGDSGILLHEAIGHPLEADFNRKGTSAYSGRMGEVVASSQCTIIDDGTIPNERGAINVDDELNPSQKTVLIEEGKLRSYMCDEISARYFGCESTGNGRRESYKFQPIPRMRTTYMLAGKYAPEEIIGDTAKGIYCKTFKGGQVDISNGNFIFVPSEAYLIEDGKITKPVKNFSLIGNGPEVLSKVSMVGHDFEMSQGIWTCGKGQSVPVGVGLPTVKISEMTVGGQQG